MLMRVQDEAEPGARMTEVNVRDEALTLFLSGHETIAMALTWTWYLLAQHPEVEAKLHSRDKRRAWREVAQSGQRRRTTLHKDGLGRVYAVISTCLVHCALRDRTAASFSQPRSPRETIRVGLMLCGVSHWLSSSRSCGLF